jgi:pre-mRNA-splicing factor CDC5/CEF1
MPDVKGDDNDADTTATLQEDATLRDRREQAKLIAAQEAEWRARSEALKRQLPRPVTVNHALATASDLDGSDSSSAAAEHRAAVAMIDSMVVALLNRDAVKYTVDVSEGGKRKSKKRKNRENQARAEAAALAAVPEFTEEELMNAKLMIQEEYENSSDDANNSSSANSQQFAEMWTAAHSQWSYMPDKSAWGVTAEASGSSRIAALMHEFQQLRQSIDKLAAKAVKAEARVAVTQGGYAAKAQALCDSIAQLHTAAGDAHIEKECHDRLLGNETLAAPRRLAEAQAALRIEEEAEMTLQNEYAELYDELNTKESEAAAAAAVAQAAQDAEIADRRAKKLASLVISKPTTVVSTVTAAAAGNSENGVTVRSVTETVETVETVAAGGDDMQVEETVVTTTTTAVATATAAAAANV